MVTLTNTGFSPWPFPMWSTNYPSVDHLDHCFTPCPHEHGMWRYGPAPKPKGPATFKKHRKSRRRY